MNTLQEQVQEQLAKIEKTIATAIKSGAKIERFSNGMCFIDDFVIYESGGKVFRCYDFEDPAIKGLFAPSLEQLEQKKEQLCAQLKDINYQIAERAKQ